MINEERQGARHHSRTCACAAVAHAHGMSAWQGVSIARIQSATVAVTAPVFKSTDSKSSHTLRRSFVYSTITLSYSTFPHIFPLLVPPAAAMATGGDDSLTPAQLASIREMLSAEIDAARARDRRSPPPDGTGPSVEWGGGGGGTVQGR